MPQHRKTPSQLKLQGTYRPDRHGTRRAADGTDLADAAPPTGLSAAERGIWREVHRVAPAGLLKTADTFLTEAFAVAVARCRHVRRALAQERRDRRQRGEAELLIQTKNGPKLSPLVTETRRAERHLADLGSRLGLAPDARSKLALGASEPPEDPEDAAFRAEFGSLRVVSGSQPG
jgi:P27 family predicted phage terminase small subunit